VGIIFDFLVMEGQSDKVCSLLARLARADALLRQAASDNAGGFGVNGVICAGMRMLAGLSMGQIQSDRKVMAHKVLAHKVMAHKVMANKVMAQVLAYARGRVGAETADKAVVAIPGLLQFM
jgi:hypothetical protein